jgi:hypothetical protein
MVARMTPRASARAAAWIVVPILLAASPAAAQTDGGPRPFQISAGVGIVDTGFGFAGGAWAQPFLAQQLEVSWAPRGLTVEGSLMHALPVSGSSATRAFTALVRAGWTGERFALTAGPSLQLAPSAQPAAQLLPTLRAAWRMFDRFGLSLGVFDVHALAPARLSFEADRFGIGYVAPLGAEAHARVPLAGTVDLQIQGLALRVANATVAALLVSGAWRDIGGGQP